MQQLQENALKSLGPEGGTPLLTELQAVTAWLFCCQINTIFCKVSAQGCTRMWRFLMDTSQRYLLLQTAWCVPYATETFQEWGVSALRRHANRMTFP